jgi:hypothetical protein
MADSLHLWNRGFPLSNTQPHAPDEIERISICTILHYGGDVHTDLPAMDPEQARTNPVDVSDQATNRIGTI